MLIKRDGLAQPVLNNNGIIIAFVRVTNSHDTSYPNEKEGNEKRKRKRFFFQKKNGFREVPTTGIIMRIIYARIRDKPTTFTGFMVHDSIISKQYSSKVKKTLFFRLGLE